MMQYPYVASKSEEKFLRVRVTNKYFGEFTLCKVLKETQKAVLVEPAGGVSTSEDPLQQWVKGKRFLYKPKWIPKKALIIEGDVTVTVYRYKMSPVAEDYHTVVETKEE